MMKKFRNLLKSPGRHLRVNITLLVCLLTSAFMTLEASASVDAVNQWPAIPTIVSNSNATTVSAKFTPGLGNNKILLVAVATKYGAAQAPGFTVTFGGVALTQILNNTAQNQKLWLGYMLDTPMGAGTKVLQVINNTGANLTAMYVTAAVYNGVDQLAPISGSGSNALTAATSFPVSAPYNVTGINGNNGESIFITNFAAQSLATYPGYTRLRADYAGANMKVVTGYKYISTGTETPTVTVGVADTGVIAGVGLKPEWKIYTNSSCGDCHSNPPQDGTATRNVPPGQFPGAHDKHVGGQDGQQYAYACTKCHPNNTTYNHANGYKNISGSSVPGNAYSLTKSIAVNNTTGNGTCNTSYCHSTGRVNAQYTNSPGWTSTGTTCLTCHAGRSAAGQNPPAHSTSGFTMSTTHSQHLKYPTANINCNMCHSKSVADSLTLKQYSGVVNHNNGVKTVLFNDINYGSYTSYKLGAGADQYKCTNVACHGGKTRAAWSNQGALNTTNTCTHCHGQPQAAAVPTNNVNRKMYAPGWVNGAWTGTSTDQNTNDNDNRVGAHFAHLSSMYMKQIKCNECHYVPTSPFDGSNNHMTGPRYSSQSITFAQASTATKNGVFTSFTSGTANKAATCSTTYCHGSKFIQGDTAGSARKPSWNQNTLIARVPSQAACSTCHGVPPNSALTYHTGATLGTCVNCHSNVVDVSGNIINKTLHINGLNNYLMPCDQCHDYNTTGGGTTWGKTNYGGTAGLEGRGAHAKHIEYLKTKTGLSLVAGTDTWLSASFIAICGTCHSTNEALDHTPGNTAGTRNINFNSSIARQFGLSIPLYNGLYNTSSNLNPKSCSNTDCHYRTSPIWSNF